MFTYIFRKSDGTERRFEVDPRRPPPAAAPAPPWVDLSYHRCPNCPLSLEENPRCPTAADLLEIVDAFADDVSIEAVEVQVIDEQRAYSRRCDLQTGLRSLVGLVMASSACPILGQLRAPAHFHLPFSGRRETLFRIVGAYLIHQYFVTRSGGRPDLELRGLRQLYDDLSQLNVAFAKRLRSAVRKDANVNAISSLFSLGYLVSFSLEEDLEGLRELFPDHGADRS